MTKVKDQFKKLGKTITTDFKKVGKAAELGINSVVTPMQKAANKATTYVDNVLHGVNDYPPGVRDIIRKNGNNKITSIQVARAPVPKAITTALNVASGGTFDQGMQKQSYDTLYHLFMYLTMDSGTKILFEKNAQINSSVNPPLPPDTESKDVPNIPQGLTLNAFLENGKAQMGNSFFPYDPHYNNCQDFILGLLRGNKLITPDVETFVKQDTGQLFANNKMLGGIAKGVTSLGGIGERMFNGFGISDKNKTLEYNNMSSSESESDEENMGTGRKREREIVRKIGKLKREIREHHEVHGGKINIAKAFKSLGSTIKKGFNPVAEYVTNKHGLASTLVNQGIPAVSGALAGGAAEFLFPEAGPLAGFVAGQAGAAGGRQLAKYVNNRTGTGMPRGRPRKSMSAGDLIVKGGKLKQDLIKTYNKIVPKSMQPTVNKLAGQVGNYALDKAGYGTPIPTGGKLKQDLVKTYNKIVPKSMQPTVNKLAGQVGNYALDKAGYDTPIPTGSGMKRKGRMVKGSAEAMAWAEKMRAARKR